MDKIIQGDPLGPRVSAVQPIEDFKLLLTFNNGERRIFDAKPLFALNVFKPLRSKTFFELVKAAYGSILWPDDIDYCPGTLYAESCPVEAGPPDPPKKDN
jgi:hypothetical protein